MRISVVLPILITLLARGSLCQTTTNTALTPELTPDLIIPRRCGTLECPVRAECITDLFTFTTTTVVPTTVTVTMTSVEAFYECILDPPCDNFCGNPLRCCPI